MENFCVHFYLQVLYKNLTGSVINGIQLTLNYHTAPPTNVSATPEMRRITITDLHVKADSSFLLCDGLSDSKIQQISFNNVTVTGNSGQKCDMCKIDANKDSLPVPKCGA